jgi:hypothetical protein
LKFIEKLSKFIKDKNRNDANKFIVYFESESEKSIKGKVFDKVEDSLFMYVDENKNKYYIVKVVDSADCIILKYEKGIRVFPNLKKIL